MSTSHEKKWKYLSIVLMGIMATGFLAPQAFAANPTLEQVLAIVMGTDTKIDTVDANVDAIMAKTDNLPADPASNSAISAAATDIQSEMLEIRHMVIEEETSETVELYRLQCNQPYVVDSVRIFTNVASGVEDNWRAPRIAADGFVLGTSVIDPDAGQQINQNVPVNVGTSSQAGVTMSREGSDGIDEFVRIGFYFTVPHSAVCTVSNL